MKIKIALLFLLLSVQSFAQCVMVKDIYPGSNASYPEQMINVNGTLFFIADDGVDGSELWKSDGTESGTMLVKDIHLNSVPSSGNYPNFTNVNGVLFFCADDGINGWELWKTDGTSAGTVMVKNINLSGSSVVINLPYLTNVNGTLFFTADDGINGCELWKSDGTSGGTVMVKDINPGTGSSTPEYLAEMNNILYFRADNGTNGEELWRSDGTVSGTYMVQDIFPGSQDSGPQFLTNVNGTLFFRAIGGNWDFELWKSDGTSGGTMLVKDINPTGNSDSYDYVNVNGILFFTATDGINGYELWKSDGTSGGTMLVKDINPGSSSAFFLNSYYASNITNVNGTLYFRATDGINGYELWKSDGTSGGTVMVKDIYPGFNSSFSTTYDNLAHDGNTLFFSADDGVHGFEPWKSDGTLNGTMMIQDIYAGSTGSSGGDINSTMVNGIPYFRADEGINGTELWKFAPNSSVAEVSRLSSQVFISPNPFTTQTTIYFTEQQKNTSIKIMDVLGKEIKTVILSGAKELIIEKGEMQSGIYFVQLIDANKNVVNRKVVVQ